VGPPEKRIKVLVDDLAETLEARTTEQFSMGVEIVSIIERGGERVVEDVKRLIDMGANVNAALDENTPLLAALGNRNLSKEARLRLVAMLVEKKANLYKKDPNGRTPLWIILLANHIADNDRAALANIVVLGGAFVNTLGPEGYTPLWYVFNGAIEPKQAVAIAEILLRTWSDTYGDGKAIIASIIMNSALDEKPKKKLIGQIIERGTNVFGTVDVKKRLVDLAHENGLQSVKKMILANMAKQIEVLRISNRAGTINKLFREVRDLPLKVTDPELRQLLGARSASRAQLKDFLDPSITLESDEFLRRLSEKYIGRVDGAERETAEANVCIRGDILFNLAVPEKRPPTGKIACVVAEFETDRTLDSDSVDLIYWYVWVVQMLSHAFSKTAYVAEGRAFADSTTYDRIMELMRVSKMSILFADLEGNKLEKVLDGSREIEGASPEVKRLLLGLADHGQTNITPTGANALPVYREHVDGNKYRCSLTFDTSFVDRVADPGGLKYLLLVAGASNDIETTHVLVAQIRGSAILMFESNYRSMQARQAEEAEECRDPMEGGYVPDVGSVFCRRMHLATKNRHHADAHRSVRYQL
jgi:hypothetical protein